MTNTKKTPANGGNTTNGTEPKKFVPRQNFVPKQTLGDLVSEKYGNIRVKGKMNKVIKNTNEELGEGISEKEILNNNYFLEKQNEDVTRDNIKERDELIGIVNVKDNKVFVKINKNVFGILDIKSLEKSKKDRRDYHKNQIIKVKVSRIIKGEKPISFLEDLENTDIKRRREEPKKIDEKKELNRANENALDASVDSMKNSINTYIGIVEPLEKILNQRNKEPVKNIRKMVRDLVEKKEKTPKEIVEIFKRAYQRDIVLHGQKQGEGGLRYKPDIDGGSFFHLLKLIGFFKNAQGNSKGENIKIDLKYVKNGDKLEKGLHGDTGGTEKGIAIEKTEKEIWNALKGKKETFKTLFGSRMILDEHDKKSPDADNKEKPTSSTRILFEILDEFNMIPERYFGQIKRFVDFVDKVDSMYYQFGSKLFPVIDKTLFGLYYDIPIEVIYKYFEKESNTGFEILSNEFLKNKEGDKEISLMEISKKQHERKQEGYRKFDELLEKRESKLYEKFNGKEEPLGFIVDLGGKIKDGALIAEVFEMGIIKIFPNGELYIYYPKKLPSKIAGIKTEGHFLVGSFDAKKIKEILDCFGGTEQKGIYEGGRDQIDGNKVKEKIMQYYEKERLETLQKQEVRKGMTPEEVTEICKKELKAIEKKDLKIGQIYKGVFNNIQGKVAYITLDNKETFKGRIAVEDRNQLKTYAVGDSIEVKIDAKEAGKLLTLSLAPAKE